MYRNWRACCPREQQVLSYLAAGYGPKQIGYALGLAHGTISVYTGRLRKQLGAGCLHNLIVYAVVAVLTDGLPLPEGETLPVIRRGKRYR